MLNLKHNLRSTYCSEANDRHEASRGLFATAVRLVFQALLLHLVICSYSRYCVNLYMFQCLFLMSVFNVVGASEHS